MYQHEDIQYAFPELDHALTVHPLTRADCHILSQMARLGVESHFLEGAAIAMATDLYWVEALLLQRDHPALAERLLGIITEVKDDSTR